MIKVDSLAYAPGQCRNCGTHTAEYFVDMQYTEDFWGHVYFCPGCVEQIMDTAEIRTPNTSLKYIAELEDRLNVLEKEVSNDRLIDRLAARGIDLERFLLFLDAEDVRKATPGSEGGEKGTSRSPRNRSKGSSEPNSSEGSASVPGFDFGLATPSPA